MESTVGNGQGNQCRVEWKVELARFWEGFPGPSRRFVLLAGVQPAIPYPQVLKPG